MTYELVVMGASAGGGGALGTILGALPPAFPAAVAVVQHRGDTEAGLCAALRARSRLPVREAEDKDPIEPGTVFLAPAGYHLLVEPGQFSLSTAALELYARPSIDVLFESAADAYRERLIGVILTGASRDGAAGLRAIEDAGGIALVQEPRTAECSIMPAAAVAATTAHQILPLERIADALHELVEGTSGLLGTLGSMGA